MHVILSLNGFNITYKSKQRAQARLDRSAPCLGLSIFQILNVQYRVLTFGKWKCGCINGDSPLRGITTVLGPSPLYPVAESYDAICTTLTNRESWLTLESRDLLCDILIISLVLSSGVSNSEADPGV